ncbi:hypothetical protein MIR68_002101 [Amoeboaphelidium protococcarum]|nr:hypothetical protein MIR68_002101 [Amoeboaphelidium protococcarum]
MPLHERSMEPQKEIQVVAKNDVVSIRASGLLVAADLASVTQKRMTVSKFHNWLMDGVVDKSTLRYIGMSMNNLLSSDMKYISAMVEDLYRRNLIAPSRLILDLSSNRVHGIGQYREEVDGAITSILSCPSVAFIDLRRNPFSSIDRRDYFQGLTKNSPEASKLIWVDEIHLPTHGWRILVSDDVIEVVMKYHAQYFAWRKENNFLY